MKFRQILLTSVAAGALAVTVGACTHSGDDGIPQSQLDAETAAKEAAEKKAAEEQAAKEQAEADAKAEKERADALQREKDAEATAAGKDKLKRLATAIGANELGAIGDVSADDNRVRHFRMGGDGNANFAKPKMDVTDTADPHAISGWHGSSYEHSPQGSSTNAAAYNNKGPAMDVLFSVWINVAPANGRYTLDSATHGEHVSIPGMPTHSTHEPIPIGADSGERGTFNGVPGRFRATDSTVQLMVDPDGAPTWDESGALTFEPDNPMAMVKQEDQSYMSLGWWLTERDSDGVLTAQAAAWGSQMYTDDDLGHGNSLTGKATFKGIAVGGYTHRVVNDIFGGHFNADAELEADFSDNSTGGSLTGTIKNFAQDGESIGAGWEVSLNDPGDADNIGTDFEVTAAADSATGTFGRHETGGTWQARFVGDGRTDPMPEGVVGEFHIGALGDPINMVGAFAASNMEEDQVDRK